VHPLRVHYRFEVPGKNILPFGIGNKHGKGLVDQQLPVCSQEFRAGEIDFMDQSGRVKGEIADGCKVVEFGIRIPR